MHLNLDTSRHADPPSVQGDSEREKGLTVTPMLDRMKPIPLPKFQMGFISVIVQPLYVALNAMECINAEEPLACLQSNESRWQRISANEEPCPEL